MVRGTTRRVIIVKSPNPDIFDEAIFFVKEDSFQKGISKAEVIKQARSVATDYLKAHSERKIKISISPFLYAVLGGICASAIWVISIFLF